MREIEIPAKILEILAEIVPDVDWKNDKDNILYGNDGSLESIELINFLLALEEELSQNYGLKIDLVELVTVSSAPMTLEKFIFQVQLSIQGR